MKTCRRRPSRRAAALPTVLVRCLVTGGYGAIKMTKLAHFCAGFDRKKFSHKSAFVFSTKSTQHGPLCVPFKGRLVSEYIMADVLSPNYY